MQNSECRMERRGGEEEGEPQIARISADGGKGMINDK